ncbi:hypothetical protein ACFP3Q_08240 [Nocardioides sp. GCM10027113]|uniref:hypothetical protein n=1 Tax=unclassified Nocardioides TaxID=2615069 RepID=UPI0036243293
MAEPSSQTRPRQVTMAGWLIMVGSALLVVTVFERIGTLRDLETRESIDEFLSTPPGNGLGLDVPAAQQLLEMVSMVAAGCAAAAGILGFHVLRRHRGARLALTLVAIPLFLSGLLVGGFLSSLVAASAVLLWLEPARAWFDGRPPRTPESLRERGAWGPVPDRDTERDTERDSERDSERDTERERRPAGPDRPDTPDVPEAPQVTPGSGPRPHQGFGQPPAATPWGAAPGQQPSPWATAAPGAPQPYLGSAPPVRPARRPGAVVAACVVTWVFSGLVSLLMVTSALALLAAPDLVLEELRRQDPALLETGVGERALQVATWITAAVTVVWSAGASVLAFLVLRGRPSWARPALAGSAAAAGVVCLLASLGSVVMVVPLVACAATLTLLLRPDVRDWCRRS